MLKYNLEVFFKLSILLLLFICAAITFSVITFIYTNDFTTFAQTQDFTAYVTAGKMVASDVKEHFYDPSEQFFWQHQLAPAIGRIQILRPFLYPAFVAIPFIIFSPMPLQISYMVWLAINLVLFIFIIKTLAQELYIKDPFQRILILSILATYPPVIYALTSGQITLFLLLALLLTRKALLQKRFLKAGLLLSLFAIKPQLLPLPFLFLLQRKEFKTLRIFLGSCVVLVIVSLCLVGLRANVAYMQFLITILHWQTNYTVDPQSIVSLRGFFQFILHTNTIKDIVIYWLLAIIALVLLLLEFWKQQKKSHDLRNDWSVMIVGMILISPYLSGQDLALLLIPAVLVASKHPFYPYLLGIGWGMSFLSQFMPLFIPLQVLYLLLLFYLQLAHKGAMYKRELTSVPIEIKGNKINN